MKGWGFLGGSVVKNTPAMQNTWIRSLGGGDPLQKEVATHFSILAWEIPWTEEPGRVQSMGSQRAGHDLATKQQMKGISWEPRWSGCRVWAPNQGAGESIQALWLMLSEALGNHWTFLNLSLLFCESFGENPVKSFTREVVHSGSSQWDREDSRASIGWVSVASRIEGLLPWMCPLVWEEGRTSEVFVENCESGHEHPGEGAPVSLLVELPDASLAPARRAPRTVSPQGLQPLRSAGLQAVAVWAAALNLDPLGCPDPRQVGHMKATWTACEGWLNLSCFSYLGGKTVPSPLLEQSSDHLHGSPLALGGGMTQGHF